MSIYRKAVNNPVTTALVFIAMAIFGIFSLINISLDKFPKFDANVIMVMSSYPGASAEDIETNLTKVLENSLNGVSDLKNLSSTSRENISLITLEFNEGVDVDVATNDVRDKLDMVNSVLPEGASLPLIFKFSADDMPIMIMAATAHESLPALEKILDDKVATPLARVSGVGTVSIAGAPKREIQVYCDPNKLEAYGLTVSTISSLIAAENRNVPSGTIDIGSNAYALRVEKEFSDPSQMLDIVVIARRVAYLSFIQCRTVSVEIGVRCYDDAVIGMCRDNLVRPCKHVVGSAEVKREDQIIRPTVGEGLPGVGNASLLERTAKQRGKGGMPRKILIELCYGIVSLTADKRVRNDTVHHCNTAFCQFPLGIEIVVHNVAKA